MKVSYLCMVHGFLQFHRVEEIKDTEIGDTLDTFFALLGRASNKAQYVNFNKPEQITEFNKWCKKELGLYFSITEGEGEG